MNLILLPAMASDRRLLEPQRAAFPQVLVPDWTAPRGRESLGDYAARLVGELPTARPVVLGGVSLGGMVAHELAHLLKPDALVLIASCDRRRALRRLYRVLRPLAEVAPAAAIRATQPIAPLAIATFRFATPEQRRVLADMYRNSDPRQVLWAIRAILAWAPRPLDGVSVRRIHGSRDWVLPLQKDQADWVIAGAGHLVNFTHPEQVNACLRELMQSVAGGCRHCAD